MNKTTYTNQNVLDFINTFPNSEAKKQDSFEIIKIFEKITNAKPQMWGPTIIGFGNYHYKYNTGHEGDAPMLAFSPRKAAFSFYIYSETEKSQELLMNLGKYKKSKACIYINKLADIDMQVLIELCKETILYLNEHHQCSCHTK